MNCAQRPSFSLPWNLLRTFLLVVGLALAPTLSCVSRADDGYRLWLGYEKQAPDVAAQLESAVTRIVFRVPRGTDGPEAGTAVGELDRAFTAWLGHPVPVVREDATIEDPALGDEGYRLGGSAGVVVISSNRSRGLLYGAFALIRNIQGGIMPGGDSLVSVPRIQRRLLNHWDNLDRSVERGYAGFSLWEWFYLPEIRTPRYRDYARALASIGLNGTVVTNVNANAQILTEPYLRKVAALAGEFRPYGVRLYLTARFSAPLEIGGLKTADPLDPQVAAWWKAKVNEIYRIIPDFGGFLVKANSEGQPGPQDYKRTHADGANLLADAVAPHGGIVMWRAFVYSADSREDRVKQAVHEFEPLDGQFRDNVVLQIKNGPLDFMPREPFSPLFGRMPRTQLALELQLTQEYLGQSVELAYLAPLWKEVLDADTFADGSGSTIAKRISTAKRPGMSVIAGVANTGTDRNWTGHLLAQSNWYAFGRLAWDPSLSSETIAGEWTRLTFGKDVATNRTIERMLLGSRETVVNYSMPLGLHHIMAEGHHFGPGPWVDGLGRADWNSTYYHRADKQGLGFDRTSHGSDALSQYAPELQALWGDPKKCPENLLLWFHHVGWNEKLSSGQTLWDALCLRYQQGVEEVRALRRDWASLESSLDAERFAAVSQRLAAQEHAAVDWRDACLLYFQTFSGQPLPAGVEAPKYPLEHYKSIVLRNMPGHH